MQLSTHSESPKVRREASCGMSWDPIWEQVHQTREWGRYPPEELIRFVARHFYAAPNRRDVRILELGCGAGANIWFLAREGFDAYGIDASETAIATAAARLREEAVTAQLRVGDIASLAVLYPSVRFDAVIDITCLQHNPLDTVQAVADQALAILKPKGWIFSMLVAAGSYGDGLGKEVEPGTFTDIREGPARGMGLCHFFSLSDIRIVFERFVELQIGHTSRSLDGRLHAYTHWVLEARQRGVKLDEDLPGGSLS